MAGVDEAGRGPLAGPVTAAAVILHPEKEIIGLRDSKKLTAQQREKLCIQIQQRALSWAVAQAEVAEIDQLNILQASLLAMKRAVMQLHIPADKILVDGLHCPQVSCQAEAIVKGDQSHPEISAASIIAKVFRDREMLRLDRLFPNYGFCQHKGYPTKQHLQALQSLGPCSEHRLSFAPVKKVYQSTR